jgi:hypothetical protein
VAENEESERTGPDDGQPMVAGMEPDKEVQQWLEEEEDKRKAREEAEGKGIAAIEYTPGTTEVPSWGKRVFAIVVLAIILIPIMWFFVIPRADAELVVYYHEGVVGGISVDARIENHGTRTMTDVQIKMTVQDSGDTRMADPTTFEGVVTAHNEASMDAITFTGDQWETYYIFIEWSFECAGVNYSGSESYDTEGEEMNVRIHHDLTP